MEYSWKQIKEKLRVFNSSRLQEFIKNNNLVDETVFDINLETDELEFFELTRESGLIALTKQSTSIKDNPHDNLVEWIKYLIKIKSY